MQRALTNSEHDRKIMAERLEALKAAQQDAKNRYNVQQDRMQQMKNEQADAEVNDSLSLCQGYFLDRAPCAVFLDTTH